MNTIVRLGAAAVMIACLAIVGSQVNVVRSAHQSAAGDYDVGTSIDLPHSVFGSAPVTVIVFGRSSCTAFTASLPRIAAIIEQFRSYQADVRLVSFSSDPSRDIAITRQLGIDQHAVSYPQPGTVRGSRTPGIVVAARDGTVLASWTGVLTDSTDELLPSGLTAGLEAARRLAAR